MLASRNPSNLLGLEAWGELEVGREANIVALSPDGKILQSFREGRPAAGLRPLLGSRLRGWSPNPKGIGNLAGQAQRVEWFEQNAGNWKVGVGAAFDGLHPGG